ncbi:MAG TPA: SRPBCC domain-containing protein [Flavobacterium sp.]|uniref:SRPBCC family protein n=1 Tax=Flavobacterium sp. TaxID=239 RepID=UPI002C92934A|nr:SRPBCC domain-containing protein [Flavobacterium sp.]HSD14715.1 SRPBCC domain-containing protein [Flavobacterium sp.]
MVNIIHRLGIKAPLEKVYEALATVEGISGWWTKDTTGISEVGKSIVVKFYSLQGNEIGSMIMEVKNLEPEKEVRWQFTSGPEEWVGTDVVFKLHREEEYTIVMFNHLNWAEEVEFKAHCSMKWAIFMLSLKQLVETGKGSPSPDDIKIDNWN